MNIVVLAGGFSPERDVSLSSGSLIANALLERGHRALLLDMYLGLQGAEDFETALALYGKEHYSHAVCETAPDLDALRDARRGGESLFGPGVLPICQRAHIVFNALHGGAGEDGRVQAAFDCLNVKYTGTGHRGCLLAMDKVLSKMLMAAEGIPTPEWQILHLAKGAPAPNLVTLSLPLFVKPCGGGSSVGVSKVETPAEIETALQTAAQYEAEVLVERMVEGREFTVGVLDGKALPIIEIIPKTGFFDYRNKYQAGLSEEVCPARVEEKTAEILRQSALDVHRVLGLGSYSRVDFMMDEAGGIYCLEANTLPGMTPTSLLPQAAAAAGIEYGTLCENILKLAL